MFVLHSTPIDCLNSCFGVGSVVLDWFKSCLSDCYQCIRIGSVLSDVQRLLYRVPQGSVLGLILFMSTPLIFAFSAVLSLPNLACRFIGLIACMGLLLVVIAL